MDYKLSRSGVNHLKKNRGCEFQACLKASITQSSMELTCMHGKVCYGELRNKDKEHFGTFCLKSDILKVARCIKIAKLR